MEPDDYYKLHFVKGKGLILTDLDGNIVPQQIDVSVEQPVAMWQSGVGEVTVRMYVDTREIKEHPSMGMKNNDTHKK